MCEENANCNEFAYNPTGLKFCKLFKAVTFDERCTKKVHAAAEW